MLAIHCKSILMLGSYLLLLLLMLATLMGINFVLTAEIPGHAQALLTNAQIAAIVGGEEFLLRSDFETVVYLPLINK
jgi:hypothetical protein